MATGHDRCRAAAESFYSNTAATVTGKACRGTACFAARHLRPAVWQQAVSQTTPVYCLGKCHSAPAHAQDSERPRSEIHSREGVILGPGGKEPGGGWAKACRMSPSDIIRAVEDSGLRGRGGAGFPTGRKWRAVFEQPATPKYVVVNADEGDPGAYIDRFIIEDRPQRLLEAVAIAGRAVGAARSFIYLRQEYVAAERALREALAGSPGGDIELVVGHGSYVCGEETALLNAIEGRRPEVRPRPPYPTEHGLYGKPTLVNNVETLLAIPWIIEHGAAAYRALGIAGSHGTKVVSLNSLFQRPGLYEVEFGIPVRHIALQLGGGLKTGPLKGLLCGGPLAGVIPPALLDTAFGFEELRAIGAMVGHGGIVAFDANTSVRELVRHVAAFAAFESCGKCTPCRLGARRIAESARDGGAGGEIAGIVAALQATSLCGLGSGLGDFVSSALRHYPEEWTPCQGPARKQD